MNISQIIRRARRLAPKKKAAAVVLGVLFLAVLAGAYFRSLAVFVPSLLLLLAVLAAGLTKLDEALRRARRKATIVVPASVPATPGRSGSGGVEPAYWWGTGAQIPPARLVQRLTKVRSVDARDVLARSATAGRWGWADIEHALELYRIGGRARESSLKVLGFGLKSKLLPLADTCYRQNLLRDDLLNAATIYQYVHDKLGPKHFQGNRRGEFFLDALAQTGQAELALRLQALYNGPDKNPNDLHLYRANAKNPSRDSSISEGDWLMEINAIYRAAGLAPLALREGDQPAFLRLGTAPVPAVADGPLVTVVMPVFRPDAFTDLAVQSALAQSYRNLEIIIVDDGSGDAYEGLLSQWEEADPRVKVVRNAPNSGAYTSRNIGYSLATGDYLTIFDGDDWQHPQKIEWLVAEAARQEDHRLVSAPWSRVGEDLMFHYRGWRGAYITPAHVSTMFPIRVIRDSLGYWDTVRKAADTEFILRYQLLVNDKDVLEVSQAPLTLSLVGSTNLSMEDFRLGYRSPDRVAYRDAYEHWHRQIRDGRHSGYLDFKADVRAFPAPGRFLPVRPGRMTIDELFVGDFGSGSRTADVMWRDIESARSTGLSVGLMHVPSILHTLSIDDSFGGEILDEFAAGRLVRVELTDELHSRAVTVYDPTSFQFTRELRSGHTADSIMVRASEPPYDPRTGVHSYAVTTVSRNLGAVFGGTVEWGSEIPHVAAVLERSAGRVSVAEPVVDEGVGLLAPAGRGEVPSRP